MSWLTVASRGPSSLRGLVSNVATRGATPAATPATPAPILDPPHGDGDPIPPTVAAAPSLYPPEDDSPPGVDIVGLAISPDATPTTDCIEGLPPTPASEIDRYLTTPSTNHGPAPPPPAFASPEFDALLQRMTALAHASTERWKIMDVRHENYMAKFWSLNDSVVGQNQLSASVADQVKDLRLSTESIKFMAQEALDIASGTRKQFCQSVSHDAEAPSHTASIDDAFAAADDALQSGLNGLVSEISDHIDQATALHPVNDPLPTAATPTRHPRFSAVQDVWSERDKYDSDAAYASGHQSPDETSSADNMPSPDRDDSPHRITSRYNPAYTRGLAPHILAWHAGAPSGGDPINGTDFMEVPDVEALDISGDVAADIAECHFDLVKNWDNPRWTQHFTSSNTGPMPSFTSGPSTTEILKQISSWVPLSDLSPTGWQTFYNKLRRFAGKWKIALMPFEAINLKYECQGHSLCLCGLGITRWRKMGDALFIILEYLLPSNNAIISTTMMSLANGPTAANGYELLWILLKEFIPMFDRTQPAPFPTWPASDNVFEFGRLILMYCDLSRHRGPPFTEAMKSRMFLLHVQGRFASIVQPYSALVGTYCPGRDGITRCLEPLPKHLTVMELARNFYDSTAIHPSSSGSHHPIQTVHAYHTTLPPSGSHNSPFAPPSDHIPTTSTGTPSLQAASTLTSGSTHLPGTVRPSHIQGYSINLARSSQQTRNKSQPNPSRRSTQASTQRTRCEGTCNACGKYGHPASRCDMLAMAIFLQRHSRNRSNAEVLKEAEERWLTRNKPFLPRDDCTPRTILANYCEELQFPSDQVDNELDWDYLHDPDFLEDSST